MIDPFGSNGKAGAATGLPGKPPRTIPTLWGHSGWLTAAGRVAGAQIPALPGRAEVYLRNPSARTDGAMRWAAELGGSPPADACEGNPGEVFPGPRGGSGVSGAGSGYHHEPAGARVTSTPNQAAVDRSERNPGRRNPGNDGRSTRASYCWMWSWPAPPLRRGHRRKGSYRGQQIGAGCHTLRQDWSRCGRDPGDPARGLVWHHFRFLRYSSRDLKSRWRRLRAACLTPLDITAAVSVKKRAAAPARHRFVTM